MRDACPESQVIAAYVDSRLEGDELESFIDHIADCDECRREVVLQLVGVNASQIIHRVPEELKARVLAASPAGACPDSQTVASYVDVGLDPEETSLLLSHLGECEDCRREVALIEMARESATGSKPVPAELKARVVSAVNRGSRRLRMISRPSNSFATVFAAAAAILVAIAVIVVARTRTPEAKPFEPPVVEKREVQPKLDRVPDLKPELPKPEPEPKPVPKIDPKPEPKTEPKTEPELPKPDIKPEPEPKTEPEPEPEPKPEPKPERSRETIPTKYATVKLTDLSGEVAIKRRGRDKREKVHGPTDVGEGDVLVAEKQTAFFLLNNYPITLQPQTQIGIAFEEGFSAPALLIEKGEALVDSSAASSRWIVATKNVTVKIEKTRAKFAAGVESGALHLSSLSGHMAGKDDYGRPFDLRTGEKLVATAETAATGKDPEAPAKASTLAGTRPSTRTIFYTTFDPATLAGVTIAEGGIEKGTEALTATDKKGVLSALVKPPKEFGYRNDYAVRLRLRTNLQVVTVVMNVEDRAQLVYTQKVRADQRGRWLTIEFDLSDRDVQLVPLNDVGGVVTSRDRIMTLGATGRRADVFGDERPLIQIDDLQVAMRAP